ncbi:hypothetical protein VBD025_10540 [Virgibacillus flavescens]|uniref:hypothetical protein n=1 Tax=Virgibacillus flavescens TaxID=1611422 RepID=UPI003D34AE94
MTEDRIRTIINELHYWKKNKMLPAVYCDYLLALYTNGETTSEEMELKSTYKRGTVFKIVHVTLLILMLPLALLIMYTTYFSTYLQVGILLLFIVYSFWQSRQLKLGQEFFYSLSFTILLLLVFVTSIFLSNTYILSSWITQLIIMLNFIGWFILGRKMNINYLTVASIFGILLAGIFFVL